MLPSGSSLPSMPLAGNFESGAIIGSHSLRLTPKFRRQRVWKNRYFCSSSRCCHFKEILILLLMIFFVCIFRNAYHIKWQKEPLWASDQKPYYLWDSIASKKGTSFSGFLCTHRIPANPWTKKDAKAVIVSWVTLLARFYYQGEKEINIPLSR